MRLWHEKLIPHLPRHQLLGQHRECCALRGNGWGKPHATVNYVFDHPRMWLAAYHRKVILEMIKRGYNPDLKWLSLFYRGNNCPGDWVVPREDYMAVAEKLGMALVYPEHDDAYLKECLDNLARKGIHLEVTM